MGIGEGVIIFGFVLAAGAQALLSVGLWLWGRWVAKRQGTGRWKLVALAPLAALCLALLGAGTATVLLVRGFGAVAEMDPASKSTALAQHISETMNISALFAVPALALYLAAVVALLVGSLKKPAKGRDTGS